MDFILQVFRKLTFVCLFPNRRLRFLIHLLLFDWQAPLKGLLSAVMDSFLLLAVHGM